MDDLTTDGMATRVVLIVDNSSGPPPQEAVDVIAGLAERLGYGMVIGPVVPCDACGFYDCVCQIRRDHVAACRFLLAAQCRVGIECSHGFDVCPECDPCTCPKAAL